MLIGIKADKDSAEVYYLQSQNGNIYRHSYEEEPDDETTSPELSAFQEYIEPEVTFLSEALGEHDVPPFGKYMLMGNFRTQT